MFSWFLLMRINSKKKTCDLWQWRENARPVATAGKRAPCLDSVWFLIGWKRVTMTLIASNTLPFSNTLKKKKFRTKNTTYHATLTLPALRYLHGRLTLHYITLHHGTYTNLTIQYLHYLFYFIILQYLHYLHCYTYTSYITILFLTPTLTWL